jgi:rfaE bifunctional protein kinase chain/domain
VTILSAERIKEIIDHFDGRTVAVVGDLMLDRYYWGGVSRISPEAPVPVVDVREESAHLGGAANVAHNIRTLGAKALLFGVVGGDTAGKELRDLCREGGFDDAGVIVDGKRPTTVKTRIIAHSQHVVRIDREVRTDIPMETQGMLLGAIQHALPGLSALILEDYNKGVLVQPFVKNLISLARDHNVPVMVDPKFRNFFEYKGVTLFKPNRKEMEDALGATLGSDRLLENGACDVQKRLECDYVLLTLGAKGMMLTDGRNMWQVPTFARRVADVSGAGDTVIATLAVAHASGATMREAATIANVAAGIVCEEVGIVPIGREALRARLLSDTLSNLPQVGI